MSDVFHDGLDKEAVDLDKATLTMAASIMAEAHAKLHALALEAFAKNPDIGLHYLTQYDRLRDVKVLPATACDPWSGGTIKESRDVWRRVNSTRFNPEGDA